MDFCAISKKESKHQKMCCFAEFRRIFFLLFEKSKIKHQFKEEIRANSPAMARKMMFYYENGEDYIIIGFEKSGLRGFLMFRIEKRKQAKHECRAGCKANEATIKNGQSRIGLSISSIVACYSITAPLEEAATFR